jgi:uncharacterized protein (TIGR00369 family)
MSIATRAQSLLFNVDRPGNPISWLWDQLHTLPGGSRVFSKLVGQAAPYTGSMGAQVQQLREGYARVTMTDRRTVRNHLNCVHAIALANLAELTGNVAMAYSLPDDARFIVAGMSIEYLAKARGTITGECDSPIPSSNVKTTYEVKVTLRDPKGVDVARATLQTLVGPKKR